MNRQKEEVEDHMEERVQELERISGLTSEQAKEYLLKTVEEEVKNDTAKMIKEMETRQRKKLTRKQKNMWSLQFRNVLQTMSQRRRFQLYSFQMTR